MEKHFLGELIKDCKPFKAKPWYNPYGDCIVYKLKDEAIVAERVDSLLTLYHSAINGRVIGFQIKGVHGIIKKFGYDALAVSAKKDRKSITSISIGILLFAAYEQGKASPQRRRGYAAVTVPPGLTIPADQITEPQRDASGASQVV